MPRRMISRSLGRGRGILLALLVVGVGGCDFGGGLSDYEKVKQGREEAKSALEAKGAKVGNKEYPGFGSFHTVDLRGATIDDETLSLLADLDRVTEVDLSGTSAVDEHIPSLVGLGTLVKLDLSGTSITDAALKELAKPELNMLSHLNVKGTKVTANGIAAYKKDRPKNGLGMAVKVESDFK